MNKTEIGRKKCTNIKKLARFFLPLKARAFKSTVILDKIYAFVFLPLIKQSVVFRTI